MAGIELSAVTKIYPGASEPAVSELNLTIDDGEFVVLVGPSGCGKTTALRMIAGLEEITSGELRIGDRLVNDLSPRDRDIAMVFQNYALYPHLNVFDNMAFGLRLGKVPKDEIRQRVGEAAQILGLEKLLDRKPKALSGGQRQRVAMGRAIVRHPQAFLMDEPLSNLDAKLRVQMRGQIARIQRELRVTTVYVTHDQVEAMTMGDRVAVMEGGHLQQVGTPLELFERPDNLFVAGFIGSPAMNVFPARVVPQEGGGLWVSFGRHALSLPDELLAHRPALRDYVGREVLLGIRPQDFADPALAESRDGDRIPALIDLVEALGTETLVRFNLEAPTLAAVDGGMASPAPTAEVVARLDPRSRIREAEKVDLVVDTTRLHLFDPESGEAIYGRTASPPVDLSNPNLTSPMQSRTELLPPATDLQPRP